MSNASAWQSNVLMKIVHVLFPLLLGAYSSYPAPAETASQSNSSSVNVSKPLEGQLNLDEELPPVSPNFGVGNRLDSKELESLSPSNVWHKVPNWMVGKWHTDEQIVSHFHDYLTGKDYQLSAHSKAVEDSTHGEQRDKSGQIWSFGGLPTTEKAETSEGVSYLVISQFYSCYPNESACLNKVRYDEIEVNKKHRISRISQCEGLETIEQIDDGMAKMHTVIKSFDNLGKVVSLQESDMLWKRIAPFKVIDKKGDLDLKELFVAFLKQTGQESLIP